MGAQLRAAPIAWQNGWSDAVFSQASREHKFVILDLHAVWCHWCHVMDAETYANPAVQALIGKRYVAVGVDADSDPDLSSRYGDWGWPATIVLGPDGSEIVKRRGYIPPQQMVSLLQAIIDDPSPGPSVTAPLALASRGPSHLTAEDRASLTKTFDAVYDDAHGGWGEVHKYIDAPSMELTLDRPMMATPKRFAAHGKRWTRICISSIQSGAACISIRTRSTGNRLTTRNCSPFRPMT